MSDTHLLQIEDERGRKVSLELMSKGLTVHHLLVERPGFPPRDLICGPEETDGYAQEGRRFKNQVVGRYTNRLAGGQTSIETREGERLSLNLERNGTFAIQVSLSTSLLLFTIRSNPSCVCRSWQKLPS